MTKETDERKWRRKKGRKRKKCSGRKWAEEVSLKVEKEMTEIG
jgi:hypothetical protein